MKVSDDSIKTKCELNTWQSIMEESNQTMGVWTQEEIETLYNCLLVPSWRGYIDNRTRCHAAASHRNVKRSTIGLREWSDARLMPSIA